MLLHGIIVTYRLPKGMTLDIVDKSDDFQGRVYVGDGMKLVVARSSLVDKGEPIQLYTQRVLNHFFYKKESNIIKRDTSSSSFSIE